MIDGLLITRNRQEVLAVNLESYANLGVRVHILDGTTGHSEAVLAFSQQHPCVCYHHLPEVSIVDRLRYGLANTGSEYCLLLSDDDHFSPGTIAKCARFLDERPDFAAAQGAFWVRGASGQDQVQIEHYCPSLEEDDPALRVLRHATFYGHTAYALHRREAYIQSFEAAQQYDGYNAFHELSASFALVASGKLKRFPDLHCLRTPNSAEDLQRKYTTHPRLWFEQEPAGFNASLQRFHAQFDALLAALPNVKDRRPFPELFEPYLRSSFDPHEDIINRHRYLLYILEQMSGAQSAFDHLRSCSNAYRDGLCDLEHHLEKFLRAVAPWRNETNLAGILPPGDLLAGLLAGGA